MAKLSIDNVTKTYGGHSVIPQLSLNVADGEFCVLVGPSGCGKSTLLRIIAGLEPISSGRIIIDGVDVSGAEPPERGIAMVFQSYALYPHMDVERNMGFGLEIARTPRERDRRQGDARGREAALGSYLRRRPRELSGGQRQRVAIGRAITRKPKLFLLDEPLSNLDAALRVGMRVEIARLKAELASTMIYVTHDQVEAMTLADRIVVMNAGRIEQVGRRLDLYERPANLFVAGFIGSPAMNFLKGYISSLKGRSATVSLALGPESRSPWQSRRMRGTLSPSASALNTSFSRSMAADTSKPGRRWSRCWAAIPSSICAMTRRTSSSATAEVVGSRRARRWRSPFPQHYAISSTPMAGEYLQITMAVPRRGDNPVTCD